jgi:hypothetical protein
MIYLETHVKNYGAQNPLREIEMANNVLVAL